MGTNFYLYGYAYSPTEGFVPLDAGASSEEEESHIGKRNAAGMYCWDCGVTLTVGGEAAVHVSTSEPHAHCPSCGAAPSSTSAPKIHVFSRASNVELGFIRPREARPVGVCSCSSFTWAIPPDEFSAFALEHGGEIIVTSEYGDLMTAQEFTRMLGANCPIRYTHLIGEHFC